MSVEAEIERLRAELEQLTAIHQQVQIEMEVLQSNASDLSAQFNAALVVGRRHGVTDAELNEETPRQRERLKRLSSPDCSRCN